MLRAVLVVFMIALSSVAGSAFDAATVIQQYNATRPECRQGESLGGTSLTPEQSAAACDRLDKLGAELEVNRYCFDEAEQEWAACDN